MVAPRELRLDTVSFRTYAMLLRGIVHAMPRLEIKIIQCCLDPSKYWAVDFTGFIVARRLRESLRGERLNAVLRWWNL